MFEQISQFYAVWDLWSQCFWVKSGLQSRLYTIYFHLYISKCTNPSTSALLTATRTSPLITGILTEGLTDWINNESFVNTIYVTENFNGEVNGPVS